jgi:hypothetical protein
MARATRAIAVAARRAEDMSDSVDDDVAALFKELRKVAMAAAQIAKERTKGGPQYGA